MGAAIALFHGGCSLSFETGPFTVEGSDGGPLGDGSTPDRGGNPDTGTPGTPRIPQYVSSATASPNGTRNFTVNRPAGAQPGDLLLLAIYANNDTNVITPDPAVAWKVIDNMPTSNCRSIAWWAHHIVGTSDASSYAFTTRDAATPQSVALVAYRGVDPATPSGPNPARVDVKGNSFQYGPISVNANASNSRIVMMPVNDQGGPNPSWLDIAGMSKRVDNGTLAFFEEPQAAAGQSTPRTAITTATDHCGAVAMVTIRPAP